MIVGLACVALSLSLARSQGRPPDDDAREQQRLGIQYDNSGQYEKAVEAFGRALKADPGSYWLNVKLGEDYALLGRFAEAHEAFARAKKIDHKQSDAYIEEGYAFAAAGDEASAQKTFTELIDADTASFAGYHHLGASLARERKLDNSEYYLEESLKRVRADPRVSPGDRYHLIIVLAMALQEKGLIGQAERLYLDELKTTGHAPGFRALLWRNLGDIYHQQGDLTREEDVLKKAVNACAGGSQCFPEAHREVLNALAGYYADRGKKAQAHALADRAWSLAEPPGQIRPSVLIPSVIELLELGQIYEKLGDDRMAERPYRRIISLRAAIPWNRRLALAEKSLAAICAKTGRQSEADELSRDAALISAHAGAGIAQP